MLFNVAAMQSQIAETQNVGSDDGRKVAAKLFQVSVAAVLTVCRPTMCIDSSCVLYVVCEELLKVCFIVTVYSI